MSSGPLLKAESEYAIGTEFLIIPTGCVDTVVVVFKIFKAGDLGKGRENQILEGSIVRIVNTHAHSQFKISRWSQTIGSRNKNF